LSVDPRLSRPCSALRDPDSVHYLYYPTERHLRDQSNKQKDHDAVI